jgi:hypothetical protein
MERPIYRGRSISFRVNTISHCDYFASVGNLASVQACQPPLST